MQKVSFEEARAIVRQLAPPAREAVVPLRASLGYMTARPVYAHDDHPPFNASAMDGFALPASIASCDLPVDIDIGQPLRAGEAVIARGSQLAHPISTGAVIPPGCFGILTKEAAQVVVRNHGTVLCLEKVPEPGLNIRWRGEDCLAGTCVLPAGHPLSAEAIGALASFGVAEVSVRLPPRLALLRTGDELAHAGQALRSGQIHDSNGPMLDAMARRAGLPVLTSAYASDDDHSLRASIDALADSDADLIVSSGGVSVGNHDRVPNVLKDMGATIHTHGVRMRPGKPVLFAVLPGGKLFIGLPGNPVAAAVAFRFFVLGAVRAALQQPPEEGIPVGLDVVRRAGTTVILKARRDSLPMQRLMVELLPNQESHMMSPMLTANIRIVIPPEEHNRVVGFAMSTLLSDR